jgi:hypothetical protein
MSGRLDRFDAGLNGRNPTVLRTAVAKASPEESSPVAY